MYILGIDAKDIYLSNHYLNTPDKTGYRIRGTNGTISTRKFVNTLDYSLDLIKLREIYEKVYRRINFGWNVGDKEYTQYVINVTFKYSVKAYNRIRKGLYIKNGWSPHEIALTDCADVRNGELVAIQIDADVDEPICDDLLGNYFWFCDGQYHVKQNVKTEVGVAALRKDLYKNGFYCDGIHYVRFKRSSGSSRVGKCLFIDEKLYRGMDKWAHCGIKIKDGQEIDLAAWEAYIALTTSSIIDTIEINPENILVINDFESVFSDDVIATRIDDNGRLISKPEQVEIKNSIWDGQSLLDSELFTGYDRYGMLLLRNRFFKSACFNTNIQWFFRQKGITSVSQLNGYTIAKRIEDIKLITTPSSIKYLKFGSLQQWLDNLDPIFGIVKHEKPTHYFDGRLVQTHYQLINSLQLTYEEMEEFLKPSIDYIHLLNTEPAVIRNHIRYPSKDDWHLPMTALESKNDIVYKLLGLNERFCETKLYSEFRRDLVRSFVKNLKCGHVLVNGNYSTLLGNPLEMLYNAIGSWNGESMLGIGNVCSTRFCDGQELLGSRSPHVTMGNILLTKNVRNEEIYKYFNLSDEVIAINSINENILSKLNGSDFDSDTMLVTDDKVLIEAARRNYNKFLVPTSLISSKKTKRQYTNSEKADLDVKTAVNKIGEIINLSQEINTLIWDMLNSGTAFDEILPLYCDVAQLDVMSGIEIDRAKKEFVVDNTLELKYLKEKYNRRDDNGRLIKPNFFGHISRQKGYLNAASGECLGECAYRKKYKAFYAGMLFERDHRVKNINTRILSISDLHIPFHKPTSVFDKYAGRVDILQLNGDIIDCQALSRFPKVYRKSPMEEILIAREYIIELIERIEPRKVVVNYGNHDLRFQNYLAKNLDSDILELMPKTALELILIDGFNHYNKELHTKVHYDALRDVFDGSVEIVYNDAWYSVIGDVIFCHPLAYSSGMMATSEKARRFFKDEGYEFGCLVMAHTHHTGSYDVGDIVMYEQGAACETSKQNYSDGKLFRSQKEGFIFLCLDMDGKLIQNATELVKLN